MAFEMKGFSGFRNKIKTARAKRLIRKYAGSTTVDGPDAYNISEKKFNKAERKMDKANRLLLEAGHNIEKREEATGADGYKVAMDFAKKKNKKNKK